ncbi:transketolase [Patescibacteria group bacterium]|nr:transketolase [Patescibacteria group bacterium]
MKSAFIETIYKETEKNDKVVTLVGDIGAFLFRFYIKDFPQNFLNMGIAEANMVGVASGLAMSGKIPFVYSIAPFVTARVFEQIKVDVCYNNANVKIIGVGSGVTYSSLGCTHHALEDVGILNTLPNMVIFSPSEPSEVAEATVAAVKHKGPVYIRISAQSESLVYEKEPFEIGRARFVRKGKDIAIFATGDTVKEALEAARILEERGVDSYVVNFHTLKPIDRKVIQELSRKCRLIISVEEHSTLGGLGSIVASVMVQDTKNTATLKILGFDDVFCRDYSKDKSELFEKYGISAKKIVAEVENLL